MLEKVAKSCGSHQRCRRPSAGQKPVTNNELRHTVPSHYPTATVRYLVHNCTATKCYRVRWRTINPKSAKIILESASEAFIFLFIRFKAEWLVNYQWTLSMATKMALRSCCPSISWRGTSWGSKQTGDLDVNSTNFGSPKIMKSLEADGGRPRPFCSKNGLSESHESKRLRARCEELQERHTEAPGWSVVMIKVLGSTEMITQSAYRNVPQRNLLQIYSQYMSIPWHSLPWFCRSWRAGII